MKKALILFVSLLCILSLVSCELLSNEPLRKEMLEYYNEDDNYEELIGEIKSTEYKDDIDELFLEIDLKTDNHDFSVNATTGYGEFTLVNQSNYRFDLELNDVITFSSATMHFYNGHVLPIISIEKNGEQLLSFSDGKENYINWIKETFD